MFRDSIAPPTMTLEEYGDIQLAEAQERAARYVFKSTRQCFLPFLPDLACFVSTSLVHLMVALLYTVNCTLSPRLGTLIYIYIISENNKQNQVPNATLN